jgi:V8-like Glu-specific endopeptidase
MRSRVLVVLGTMALTLLLPGTVGARSASDAAKAQADYNRIIAYWTPARIAAAKWRDYSMDPKTGKITPNAGKPGSGGGGVTGASWTGGGQVYSSVGRILFSSGGSQWICSGTVVNDGSTSNGYSIVLSAGHCAWDGTDGWSSNFVFYPNFDVEPTYTCQGRVNGCWTADRLAINSGFYPSGFGPDSALRVDYSFAHLPSNTNGELDNRFHGFGLRTSNNTAGDTAWAFGYPAEGKYKGKDLIYCTGVTSADPNGVGTWGLPCNMNGGSSGGGWLWGTTNPGTDNTKQLASVNSYGYSGLTYMFGPRFDSQTTAVFNAAVTGTAGSTSVVH